MSISRDDITAHVREVMQTQQAELLKLAASNALQLARDEAKKNATALRDELDQQLDGARELDQHAWNNQINKSNFDALRSVHQMWERTERLEDAMEPSPDQQVLKDSATKFIKEGKNLTHQRLKVLRFADRDGWSAALNFLSDNLAENEHEEKRMKRGKKEAERERASKVAKNRQSSSTNRNFHTKSNTSLSRRHTSGSSDPRACYVCGELGHIAKSCYQNHSNRGYKYGTFRNERF